MRVLKGHGTGNDFVVVPDLEGALELSPALVRALCDRHAGIGADGVLRVVRSENEPSAAAMAAQAPYFMDYRNADGSVAEMCGNGIRVVFRYLVTIGVVEQSAAVATRGGIKCVWASGDGDVTVKIGSPRVLADRPVVTAALAEPSRGTAVDIPNPHVVVQLSELPELAALDLSRPPTVEPARGPSGQNVEFVVRTGPRHLVVRVHERGVGETQSCGTGVCAAVAAVASADGSVADGAIWQVDVPGGRCQVTWGHDGEMMLAGPAVMVAEIELDDAWLAAASGESGLAAAPVSGAAPAGG